MAPPKQLCLLYAQAEAARASLLKTSRDIKALIDKIVLNKAKIKFGMIDFADVVGAELLSAIESVAASVAQAALGALSKASAAILELIFSEILKILLGAPTAIFSLVAIPQTQAREACNKERMFLSKAKINFDAIFAIIIKWTQGQDSAPYYEQMKRAMPYITKSIDLISDMINMLEGVSSDRNAVFDESKYRQVQINLHNAIRETKPYSTIDNILGIDAIIESDTAKIYSTLEKKINEDYGAARSKASKEYMNEVSSLPSNNIIKTAQMEVAKNKYSTKLNVIAATRKLQLAKAQLEAKAKATFNASNYLKAVQGIGASFVFDMQQIGKNLEQLYHNILQAYANYKISQLLCNNVYNIRSFIQNIINELINLIRKGSNLAGDAVIQSLEVSGSIIEVVQEKFNDSIAKVESSQPISAIQLSQMVFLGNQMLSAADANLDATITESLIKLINADDMLVDASGKFDDFIKNVENIPDWDGKKGVWAVDMLNSAPSPYIKFITNITEMVSSVPAIALSKNQSEKNVLRTLMINTDQTLRVVRRHNSVVTNVLYSYTPYMGSEIGNLMRFLSNAGMLQSFAMTMSIAQVAIKLASDLTTNFDQDFPSYENCKKEYGDDPAFQDSELALVAAKKERDIPSPHHHKRVRKSHEEVHDKVMRLKKEVSSFSINPKAKDLYGNNA